MNSRRRLLLLVCLACCFTAAILPANFLPRTLAADIVRAEVDATSLARHLLHCKLTFQVSPGQFTVWFPKWIPGIHGPGANIGNVAGLIVTTPDGDQLEWQRDPDELYRFIIQVPEGTNTIHVALTYIANQPSKLSTSVDTHANADVLAINFNTCLLYPASVPADEIPVQLSVKLPAGWNFGTALRLKGEPSEDGWHHFEPTSLARAIDSPLIAGRHYRRLDITTPNFPTTAMHFVSESPEALQFDAAQEARYRRLFAEAAQMFGTAPFRQYHFLVICSDRLPSFGLEHHESSLNGISEEALTDEDKRKGWSAYLLPHELVHAWCGKYRRPAGMYRQAFHTNKQTELLWIYEGLTQYLGHVLTARSGLLSFDEHLQWTASRVGYLSLRTGRQWRSLADTAVANYTLRGSSPSWNDLRRGQDYYDEGALFWLEADCLIREKTGGQHSLDDFCRNFFRAEENHPRVKPYDLDEVIAELESLVDHDWRGLIRRRVYIANDELQLDGLYRAGYEYTYVDELPKIIELREDDREYITAAHSLGVTLNDDATVRRVAPGGAADEAGLATNMEIIGVGGRKFTESRFRKAIARSKSTGKVELLVLDGDVFRTITIAYDGGQRYPALVRLQGRPDLLKTICTPRTQERTTVVAGDGAS